MVILRERTAGKVSHVTIKDRAGGKFPRTIQLQAEVHHEIRPLAPCMPGHRREGAPDDRAGEVKVALDWGAGWRRRIVHGGSPAAGKRGDGRVLKSSGSIVNSGRFRAASFNAAACSGRHNNAEMSP